jgi:hypothetical protein
MDDPKDEVGPIEQCGHPAASHFSFVCPQKWDALAPTESPNVRACDLCRERVYLVDSDDALLEHADKRHCIALRVTYESSRLEEAKREVLFAGRPRPIDYIKAYVRRHPRIP